MKDLELAGEVMRRKVRDHIRFNILPQMRDFSEVRLALDSAQTRCMRILQARKEIAHLFPDEPVEIPVPTLTPSYRQQWGVHRLVTELILLGLGKLLKHKGVEVISFEIVRRGGYSIKSSDSDSGYEFINSSYRVKAVLASGKKVDVEKVFWFELPSLVVQKALEEWTPEKGEQIVDEMEAGLLAFFH